MPLLILRHGYLSVGISRCGELEFVERSDYLVDCTVILAQAPRLAKGVSMKRSRQMKLFQPAIPPNINPKVKATAPRKIIERSKVILTQNVLYRTKGGPDKLIRPGHKTIPRGTIGTVMAISDEGKSFQVEFTAPVAGVLSVNAPEIMAWI